jgi:hypothetical protein
MMTITSVDLSGVRPRWFGSDGNSIADRYVSEQRERGNPRAHTVAPTRDALEQIMEVVQDAFKTLGTAKLNGLRLRELPLNDDPAGFRELQRLLLD